MRATVVSIGPQKEGSFLLTAISSGSTTLEVDEAGDFDEDGGQVSIGVHTLTYTGVLWSDVADDAVTVDTLVLSGTAGFSAAKWTRVDVLPEKVHYVIQVKPAWTTGLMNATLDHHLINDAAFDPAAVVEGTDVEITYRGGQWYVTHLYDREPALNLANAVPQSLPLVAIAAGGAITAGTVLTATSSTTAEWQTVGGGGAGSLFAYFDGGLNGDPAYTFTDGGLYS